MMVNCPKCGFSQPQDQYCAKCGVDMTVFRPVAKPLLSQILGSTIVQIAALAIVGLAVLFYIRHQNQERARLIAETPIARDAEAQETALAAAQLNGTTGGGVSNPTETTGTPIDTPEETAPTSASARQAPIQTSPAPSAAPFQAAQVPSPTPLPPGVSPTPPATAAGVRAALSPATQLRVAFIEGPRTFLNALLNDATQVAVDGPILYGVVSNLDQRLRASRGWTTLDSAGGLKLQINQPNVVFKGTRDQASGQNVGFTAQIIPLTRDEVGTHVQIDLNRVLLAPGGGLDVVTFQLPESFTIPKGGSFLLIGALPHRTLIEPEERLYRNVNVLKSMSTEGFKNGTTEVAIIVETR